ncbi:Phosphoglycerate kinase [Methanocaldococcus vulcanius M7]|uniref:Phosphoglycerate kinase n=1 Tax=Methanocaldococcus vulcanius (strain ATCC 700851 / DSM 12094 / M7) TaxID=579137 RepID=C9RFQ1_METVM|nr:phosphoglycerate kinase [Methanocaldococcus vulcanius]ACX72403.1 Phosphoglycerate kinase [Methanocaldococcus vulcanius M7]
MFLTLDDFNFEDKRVVLRVDINCPIDPNTEEILDDKRIREIKNTITELINRGAKVVILAHQSRPGKKDFTTLKNHAKVLSRIIGKDVKYVDEVIGTTAREAIVNMKNGDVVLLENIRFYSEEVLSEWKKWEDITPKKQAETNLIKRLSPLFDYFINDAFAAAHRAQPSLVGFSYYMPMIAGRLMEKEVSVLSKVLENPEKPCVYVLGGAKADDSIRVIKNVLENGTADKILTSGIVANIFLIAMGYDLGINMNVIENLGLVNQIEVAKRLLDKFGEKIEVPVDVAINVDDERIEEELDKNKKVSGLINDIGEKTIKHYQEIIKNAKTIVANGPAGVFEKEAFAKGTEELLKAIAVSNGFSVIGGGHLSAAAELFGLASQIDHVSTGGGATLDFLAGEKLPVIEMLKESYKKYKE